MTAWNMMNPKTKTNQRKEMRRNDVAHSKTDGLTPMIFKMNGDERYQRVQSTTETTATMRRVWAATWFTIFRFLAPAYWATSVDQAMAKPLPREMARNDIGKLTDTLATASLPRRPTQYASMSW